MTHLSWICASISRKPRLCNDHEPRWSDSAASLRVSTHRCERASNAHRSSLILPDFCAGCSSRSNVHSRPPNFALPLSTRRPPPGSRGPPAARNMTHKDPNNAFSDRWWPIFCHRLCHRLTVIITINRTLFLYSASMSPSPVLSKFSTWARGKW